MANILFLSCCLPVCAHGDAAGGVSSSFGDVSEDHDFCFLG